MRWATRVRARRGDGVDLDRVWVNVAAEVWRRHPGRLERTAARLLRSPGLARALLNTPSLLLPWLIASTVVLAAGALAQRGAGQPLVWLIAPAVAAVGIAYCYGPGLDPAWELSCSMPVSDRLVLLTRAVAVFAVNAGLGLIASAATLGHARLDRHRPAHLRLAAADDRRLRARARGGGGAQVADRRRGGRRRRLGHPRARLRRGRRRVQRRRRLSAAALAPVLTDANLYLPYLAVAACCAAIALFTIRPQRGLL